MRKTGLVGEESNPSIREATGGWRRERGWQGMCVWCGSFRPRASRGQQDGCPGRSWHDGCHEVVSRPLGTAALMTPAAAAAAAAAEMGRQTRVLEGIVGGGEEVGCWPASGTQKTRAAGSRRWRVWIGISNATHCFSFVSFAMPLRRLAQRRMSATVVSNLAVASWTGEQWRLWQDCVH